MNASKKASKLGPFKPTLILHGGAGALSRSNIPPELWAHYHASLSRYLTVTRELLDSGASALDAACNAVTLFEDDILFNCGQGSVFTERGTIEMEASVMVSSVDPSGPSAGGIKRAAAVSNIRNTRHPILLAKEVLLTADEDGGLGGTSTMHCHLSGQDVEEWGFTEKLLEKKPDHWFWTQRRWDEHRRGLRQANSYTYADLLASVDPLSELHQQDDGLHGIREIPSQGTVGAVCLDSWGNLAVATSTGGLTNKKVGRIGDTPTVGSGFWAESWDETALNDGNTAIQNTRVSSPKELNLFSEMPALHHILTQTSNILGSCFGPAQREDQDNDGPPPPAYTVTAATAASPYRSPPPIDPHITRQPTLRRLRAVAMSGTGNGDSFVRVNACRTVGSICRLDDPYAISLSDAMRAIAGPDGELQRSAGARWGKTGEAQGGMIGIEVVGEEEPLVRYSSDRQNEVKSKKMRGRVAFDFNCGGLFRAYYEIDERTGKETPRIMVFKEEY